MPVVLRHILANGPLQLRHAAEAAPSDALARQLGKEALHLVEPAGPLGQGVPEDGMLAASWVCSVRSDGDKLPRHLGHYFAHFGTFHLPGDPVRTDF